MLFTMLKSNMYNNCPFNLWHLFYEVMKCLNICVDSRSQILCGTHRLKKRCVDLNLSGCCNLYLWGDAFFSHVLLYTWMSVGGSCLPLRSFTLLFVVHERLKETQLQGVSALLQTQSLRKLLSLNQNTRKFRSSGPTAAGINMCQGFQTDMRNNRYKSNREREPSECIVVTVSTVFKIWLCSFATKTYGVTYAPCFLFSLLVWVLLWTQKCWVPQSFMLEMYSTAVKLPMLTFICWAICTISISCINLHTVCRQLLKHVLTDLDNLGYWGCWIRFWHFQDHKLQF